MKRLDITDQEVLNSIEEKYSISKANAVLKASEAADKLLYTIDYYNSHSYDDVCLSLKKKVELQLEIMDKETALKNATMLAFKNKGIYDASESDVKDIMDKLSTSEAANIIRNYKRITYKEEVSKELKSAKLNYDFFTSIKDTNKMQYASLFQELQLAGDLYRSRLDAIKNTADELGLEEPLCLENIDAIHSEGVRILATSDTDENEKSFIAKTREKLSNIKEHFGNDETMYAKITALSFMAGACNFLNRINHSTELTPALISAGGTFAVLMAGLTTINNAANIKNYFKNKSTIEEAKNLGVINLLENWCYALKEFNEFETNIKYNAKENNGGANGLHK